MLLLGARILVISGIALFGLRGVLGDLTPVEMVILVTALLVGASVFARVFTKPGRCPIGELGCRRGLLSPGRVEHILSLQKAGGGLFGEIALRQNYLTSKELAELLQLQGE